MNAQLHNLFLDDPFGYARLREFLRNPCGDMRMVCVSGWRQGRDHEDCLKEKRNEGILRTVNDIPVLLCGAGQ